MTTVSISQRLLAESRSTCRFQIYRKDVSYSDLYILLPCRRKSIRKDTSELRYYYAFNATYQSSPRKMISYFNSRITRFSWLSTFRQRIRKDMLLLYMSRVQRAVVVELRIITYFLRFSDPEQNHVSNLLISVQPISSVTKKGNLSLQIKASKEYRGTHRVYPWAKNRDGVRSCPGKTVHASGAYK